MTWDDNPTESPTLDAGRWVPRDEMSQPVLPPIEPTGKPSASSDPHRRSRIIATVVTIMCLAGAAGFVTTIAVLDDADSVSVSGLAPTSPRAPASNDNNADVLGDLILRQRDVETGITVILIPDGTDHVGQPTLDLCNGRYATESARTARRQVAAGTDLGEVAMSTEAVLYRDASSSERAFAELRDVTTGCPDGPVRSPVNGDVDTTRFAAPPDGDWEQTATVERQAYDFTTTDDEGNQRRTIAVYLRRGRALLGLYFTNGEANISVAGKATLPDIVGVFAARLANVPAAVVND
jgi:hypothetical protein